ncbi:MAG TPA: hypothetical protein G4O20_00995 [Dehalococcoidia bacterium]|nr:hypothetical protein [Dehalococcoidia bacterium]
MAERKKTARLYDVGGVIIAVLFFGIPFGSIFDYLWNLLVLSLALPRLAGDKIEITKGKRLAYCFFITLLGIIIDWAYFEFTWDTDFGKSAVWIPAMPQALQFVWLLLPMAMIGLVNAALSYSYLKLERRQAIIFGAIMGFFTAPWLLPIVPYVFGWVV